jgi:hypothetical protein
MPLPREGDRAHEVRGGAFRGKYLRRKFLNGKIHKIPFGVLATLAKSLQNGENLLQKIQMYGIIHTCNMQG